MAGYLQKQPFGGIDRFALRRREPESLSLPPWMDEQHNLPAGTSTPLADEFRNYLLEETRLDRRAMFHEDLKRYCLIKGVTEDALLCFRRSPIDVSEHELVTKVYDVVSFPGGREFSPEGLDVVAKALKYFAEHATEDDCRLPEDEQQLQFCREVATILADVIGRDSERLRAIPQPLRKFL